MPSSYFLINDEIRFYFEAPTKSLHCHQKEVNLTPREAQTLQYLLDKRGGAIKPDDLAVHLWGEASVNLDYANKKSQAVTLVSKVRRRFEQLDYRSDWLKNLDNQGYKVNCSVEFISSEVLRQQTIERKIQHEKLRQRRELVKYGSTSAFVSIFIFFLLYLVFAKSSIGIDNISQLPPLTGISAEPNLSPNGKAVAFSYESRDGHAQIYIKVDSDINYQTLTSGYFDQGPVFSPDGTRLAFHRRFEDDCEIRLIELDKDYHVKTADKKVVDCDPFTHFSSITWLSQNELLFTKRDAEESPMQVYKLDLDSGEVSTYLAINDKDNFGSGYYFVHYDIASETLLVMEGDEWSMSHIYRYGKNKQLVWLKTTKEVLKSISLLDNKVVFKDVDNQVKAFLIDDPTEIEVIYSHPLERISYPQVNVGGDKITYATGSYLKSSVHRYDLTNGSISETIAAKDKLELPKASEKEVLVVSSSSGIYQIYSYANNNRTQLTNFKVNHKIINYATSPNRRWLAIHFVQGTKLYQRDEKGLTQVQFFESMTHPGFSPKSQRLLLSDAQGGALGVESGLARLVDFDLSKFHQTGRIETSGTTIKDAAFGAYSADGIVYTPANSKGLYLYKVGDISVINESIEPAPESFGFTSSHVYLLTKDETMLEVALDTGEVRVLPTDLYGEFSVNQNSIFFLSETPGHMDIIIGDIIKNQF